MTSQCFKKPLNNLLAWANNKHCSLHRISQVDMKDDWLADINVAWKCFLCRLLYHQGKPLIFEGSLVTGFLLVIVYWQTGLCGLDGKHPDVQTHITRLIRTVKHFSQWGVTWKQTGKRGKVSYKEFPLFQTKRWSGAKGNVDLDHTTEAGTIIWLPVSHTVLKLIQ